MVTAFGREDIRSQAEEIGVDSFLLKPVNTSLLYDTLVDLFAAAADHPEPHKSKPTAAAHLATGIRVLLVEDNEMNQQIARELLESAGATVSLANDGAEAVKILTGAQQPPPFDVVFMDMQMPKMDGITATKLIRNDDRLKQLPIIAMTAHALAEERQRCLEAGMNDHVSKPIDPDTLFSTLLRWAKSNQELPSATPRPIVSHQSLAKPDRRSSLPHIAGVNVAEGLNRVAGNQDLYLNLLSQFVSQQGTAAAQIAAALDASDCKLAERTAHTVKGVAGNLGISEVQSAAHKLETAIRESQDSVPTLLDQFAITLRVHTNSIAQALPGPTQFRTSTDPRNRQRPQEAIDRLRALLEANDGDSIEAFQSLREAVAGVVDQQQLDSLSEIINQFEFTQAIVKLNEIVELYNQNGR